MKKNICLVVCNGKVVDACPKSQWDTYKTIYKRAYRTDEIHICDITDYVTAGDDEPRKQIEQLFKACGEDYVVGEEEGYSLWVETKTGDEKAAYFAENMMNTVFEVGELNDIEHNDVTMHLYEYPADYRGLRK